jgi:hypothetical protein
MTKPIQLHVGYVGVTREGMRVKITGNAYGGNIPFISKERLGFEWAHNGACVSDGGWRGGEDISADDIVGPWVEEPVKPIVDYNDGNWHRWGGGNCPVHPETEVELMPLNPYDTTMRPNTVSATAIHVDWGVNCDNPIVSFCVTEEFIKPKEPRELWVSLNDYQAHETEAAAQDYDKHLGCHHGYFRVKEII